MAKSPSVFRQSLPLLITSLVNKSGSIGLSLLPMLLVEGSFSTAESSLAMSFVKGSTVAATLASGWMSDVIGLRTTLLISFLLAACGLGVLPLRQGFWILLISAVIAQVGITSVNSTMRLLLTRTVDRSSQKEALGWMRFVNNLGQVFSFGLATMSATFGARLLIWFDALTSLLALVIGTRILPRAPRVSEMSPILPATSGIAASKRLEGWWPFIGCTLLLMGWNFMYEFFMAGVAGRLKLLFPVEGLRIFSLLMVVNTILCAALAVVASRALSRVVPSLSIGVLLASSGLILGVYQVQSLPLLFVSILLLTLGEIVYGALGQFLLIRSVPASRRENTVYSGAILMANLGRMLAAGLAFPQIIYASNPSNAAWIGTGVGVASLMVLLVGGKAFARVGEA